MWSKSEFPAPDRLLNLSVGLASPLWPTFYVAATAGMAFWGLSALARTASAAAGGTLSPRRAVLPAPTAAASPAALPAHAKVPAKVPAKSPAVTVAKGATPAPKAGFAAKPPPKLAPKAAAKPVSQPAAPATPVAAAPAPAPKRPSRTRAARPAGEKPKGARS